MLKAVTAGFVTLTISIFALSANARPLDPISTAERDARLAQFNYTPWNGTSTLRQADYDLGCQREKYIITITDPVNGAHWDQWITSYRPVDVPSTVPVVIIIPTIEGEGILEDTVGREMCANKMGAIVADVMDTSLPKTYPAWGLEDIHNRWGVLALRTVIDYAQNNQYFDKDRVGMLGMSLGGIVASLMAGVEPERLKAIVTIVGGGNMPHILTYSDHGLVSSLRANRMKALGWTDLNLYENALRDSMKLDPLYFASNARKDNILMLLADADHKVPTVDQYEQWNAFGQPKGFTYHGDHIPTILTVVYTDMGATTGFLNAKFNYHPLFMVSTPPPSPMVSWGVGKPVAVGQ